MIRQGGLGWDSMKYISIGILTEQVLQKKNEIAELEKQISELTKTGEKDRDKIVDIYNSLIGI